jgi:spore germination protein KC
MKRVTMALVICLLLAGCWDEVQLKKLLFVDIIGVDYEGDSKKLNVSFVISSLRNAYQGGGIPSAFHIESTGTNLYDAIANTNKLMPGSLSALETRLYLISTKFAKDQPLSYLNITSQFFTNPLYAYLAVYEGDPSKLLAKKKIKDQTASEFLVGLLDDEKKRGRIPSNKLLHFMLGGREFINDFALNRFEPYGDGARLAGIALFRDGKYTGFNLNDEDTQLAILMDGATGKSQFLTGKLDGKSYSVLVQKANRDFQIIHNDNSLSKIEISIELGVKLIEDDHQFKKHTDNMLKELENGIEADIMAKAANVIASLQKANCDYLQLGHEVAAYYPEMYKGMNWREQYPKISIKPKVKIKILNSGILAFL